MQRIEKSYKQNTVVFIKTIKLCISTLKRFKYSRILSRYFADGKGIGSEFEAFFTTLRLIGPDVEVQECGVEEYDCDDATCISKELGRAQISNYGSLLYFWRGENL